MDISVVVTASAATTIVIIIIRLHQHRSTTYVDAAYSCRRNRVVCWSAMIMSPAETAEPIERLFLMLSGVGPGNNVLHVGAGAPCEKAILRGKVAGHCKV